MNIKPILYLYLLNYCFIPVMHAQNLPSYVPSNGLISWYPFSLNAKDSSGNGNNGTVRGASLTSDRFNHANKAYTFNGNGNRITFSNKFPFHDTGSKTLSIWVKLGTITNSAKQGTILKSSLDSVKDYNRFNLYIRTTTGMILDYRSSSSNMGTNLHNLNIRNGISKDTWQHVVYTRVNNVYKLYINGGKYNTFTDPSPSLPSTVGWILGDDPVGNLDFAGSLDDIGLWNRALSDSEIVKLYQAVDKKTGINETRWIQTKIYPNPFSDIVHLDYEQSIVNCGYRVCISTALSEVVYQKEITNAREAIQANALGESGIYFLMIYNAENQMVCFKRLILSKDW